MKKNTMVKNQKGEIGITLKDAVMLSDYVLVDRKAFKKDVLKVEVIYLEIQKCGDFSTYENVSELEEISTFSDEEKEAFLKKAKEQEYEKKQKIYAAAAAKQAEEEKKLAENNYMKICEKTGDEYDSSKFKCCFKCYVKEYAIKYGAEAAHRKFS